MTTKYQNIKDVPLDVIVARLKELATAITEGRESQSREFTMRIPAECDRDADLVIDEAATRVELLQAKVAELEGTVDRVGAAFRIGSAVRTEAVIFTCVRNTRDFTDKLHAIEREFFMVPGEPDEEFPDEPPEPVCELNSWGTTKSEYVAQFRAALLRKQAEAVDALNSYLVEVNCGENQHVVEDYAQSLRQQADDAENSGGES